MRRDSGTGFTTKKNIDIRHRKSDFSEPEFKKRKTSRKFFVIFVLLLLLAGSVFAQQVFFSKETVPALKELTRLPVIREIRQFTGANDNQLKGESRDRINILVMGQGGLGHPGPFLTDTIMLASFKPSTGQIGVLSIPRDMVVQIPDNGLERINAANAHGEANDYPGGGANFAARVLEDTLDIPINYYARVDFNGFEQLIDDIGGLEIYVDKAFTDYEYPDNNLGYQTVHFDAGPQSMDGERALQYSRSRHAEGEAGDFARVKRQQKLMLAFKDKLLRPGSFLNPSKLASIYNSLNENISTNVQVWEIPLFMDIAKQANFDNVTFMVLDDSPAGPLYSTTLENGAYVLAPKISDYSEIQFIVKNIFTINDIKTEESKLVIQNGTPEEGLALNTAAILSSFEFDILKISNAPSQSFERTVLYDLSGDTMQKSKKFLEQTLQTKSLDSLPVNGDDLGEADFLIILGKDQIPAGQDSQVDTINESL